MRTLCALMAELPTFLMAGEVIGDSVMRYGKERPSQAEPSLQGEFALSAMPQIAVPTLIGEPNPYLAQPKEAGPMSVAAGATLIAPTDGFKTDPLDVIVDPVQRFLMAGLPIDGAGAWAAIKGNQIVIEPMVAEVFLPGASVFSNMPQVTIPRREVVDSGIFKKFQTCEVGGPYAQAIPPSPFQSSVAFTLAGTTVTGAGVALGDCRVVAMQTGWLYVDNAPVIIAETQSDGSGNFSMLLRNIDYQLYAYKSGSPDVAGVSRSDVTPLTSTTVYLRDPTAADSGGGGGTTIYPFGG